MDPVEKFKGRVRYKGRSESADLTTPDKISDISTVASAGKSPGVFYSPDDSRVSPMHSRQISVVTNTSITMTPEDLKTNPANVLAETFEVSSESKNSRNAYIETIIALKKTIHNLQLRDAIFRQDNEKLRRQNGDLEATITDLTNQISILEDIKHQDAEYLLQQEKEICKLENALRKKSSTSSSPQKPSDETDLLQNENKLLKARIKALEHFYESSSNSVKK